MRFLEGRSDTRIRPPIRVPIAAHGLRSRRGHLLSLLFVLLLLIAALAVHETLARVAPAAGATGTTTRGATVRIAAPLPGPGPAAPVADTWLAPGDLPEQGAVVPLSGALRIPSTAGFAARSASLYLPPAALTPDPPPLPLVVFMMGQPGSPDPGPISEAMDRLASEHHGLAPIVIVADQLGAPDNNPACVDSAAFGGVEEYFTTDIPHWARTHLRIAKDPSAWTIAGFSNGGGCALAWGIAHPDVWGNVVSLSGESFQGTEFPDEVLQQVFGGDEAAYEAAKPATTAARNAGRFAGHVAVFTAGDQDPVFTEQTKRSAQIAHDAGFETSWFAIPGADHTSALVPGLLRAFPELYPRLGLAPQG